MKPEHILKERNSKIFDSKPKDYDSIVLLISISIIVLIWAILGIILIYIQQEVITSLATIILATVTVLAALQNEIRAWWYRPKLSLICGMDKGSYKVGLPDANYIRVKVRNFGRGVAKSCYVKLINVLDQNGNEIVADPINFPWASTLEENKQIAPFGSREYFDLMYVGKTKVKGDQEERDIMLLRGTLGHRYLELGDIDYFVNLSLNSDNQVKKYTIRIHNNKNPDNVRVSLRTF